MSCCRRTKTADGSAATPIKRIDLTYMGNSSLTAIGPMTGRRYKFVARGAVLAVDPHDVPALLQVPNLLRLR